MLTVVPVLVVWSATAWAVPPPIQTRVLALVTPDAQPQTLALTSSAVYLGAALGGSAGGMILSRAIPGWLPAVAGVCALVALLLFLLTWRIHEPWALRPKTAK